MSSRYAFFSVLTAAAVAACGSAGGDETSGEVRRWEDAIRAGTPVAFPSADAYVYFNISTASGIEFGTGVLLSPDWVLTAAHVVDGAAQGAPYAPENIEIIWGNITDPSSLYTRAQAVYLHPDHSFGGFASPSSPNDMDVALVRLESSFTNAPNKSLGNHTSSALLGAILACSGYGYRAETNGNPSGGSGVLTFALLTPTAQRTQFVTAPQNLLAQVPLEGDSGGGCVLPVSTSVLAGLISGGDSIVPNAPATETYIIPASRFRTWVQSTMSNCGDNQPRTASYCDSSCRCSYGQGDCDADSQCNPSLACDTDVGAAFNMPPNYEVCVHRGCETRSIGSDTYCDAACPCGIGGGDCDSDSGCVADLVCATDYGPAFGARPITDVCVPFACEGRTVGSSSFCSSDCPCGYGGGDCDSDSQCMPGLKCARDFGPAFDATPATDVCVVGDCNLRTLGSSTFCDASCPCGYGGGDCDSNSGCMPDLVCVTDVGTSYDMTAATDVCLPGACASQVPATTNGCSVQCPCGHGGGDCDSNAECMPGLTCGTDNGASFGMPSNYDVCVR